MKHFLKFSGSLFAKLLVARIFGFILSCTILLAISDMVGSILTQCCSAMLVVVLIFSTAWEAGAKDANMLTIQKGKADHFLGLKAGLLATLPDLIMAICLILTKVGMVNSYFTVIFGIYNSNFLPFHQAVLPQTLTVAENPWYGFILSAATVLIAPLCAAFGYRLGLLQLSLSDTLLYTTPAARERHEMRLKKRKNNRLTRRFR
jgi:hypothetical protein